MTGPSRAPTGRGLRRVFDALPDRAQHALRVARMRSQTRVTHQRSVTVPGSGPVIVLDAIGAPWGDTVAVVERRRGRTERLVVLTDQPVMHVARELPVVVEYVPASMDATGSAFRQARIDEIVRVYDAESIAPIADPDRAQPVRRASGGYRERMSIRRVAVVATASTLFAAAVLVASLMLDWGTAWAVVSGAVLAIGLLGAAAVGVVAIQRLVRLLLSIQKYARLSSERTAVIRPSVANLSASVQQYARLAGERSGGVAGRVARGARAERLSDQAVLVLALGAAVDDADLERFVRSNPKGSVVLVTDRADAVPRLARDVVVEFIPAGADELGPRVGEVSARLVQLAAEHGSAVLVDWPEVASATTLSAADVDQLSVLGGRALRSLLQVDDEVRRRFDLPSTARVAGRPVQDPVPALDPGAVEQLVKRTDLERAVKEIDRSSAKRRGAAVREVRSAVDDAYRQLESLIALHRRLDDLPTLPHLRGWAVSPDLALDLVDRVLSGPVRTVLELGSGTSTVLFAIAFDRVGDGHVTTLEHDAGYAAHTRALLDRYGVAHRATVIHTPLEEMDVDGEPYRWYRIEGLDLPNEVDLLFVDGPPEATGPKSRYPAVPLLVAHLGDDAEVILDDGRRPDETEIVALWSQRPDIVGSLVMPHERMPVSLHFQRAAPPTAVGGPDGEDSARSTEPHPPT